MIQALTAIAVISFFGGCCFRAAWFHRVKLKPKLIKLAKGLGYWYLGLMITALCIGLGRVSSEESWVVLPVSLIAGYAVHRHWKGIK